MERAQSEIDRLRKQLEDLKANGDADRENKRKLVEEKNVAEEKIESLKKENDFVRNQNDEVAERQRRLAQDYDHEKRLDELPEDYIETYKTQLEQLNDQLQRKDVELSE